MNTIYEGREQHGIYDRVFQILYQTVL
jgi:hypothetical protein